MLEIGKEMTKILVVTEDNRVFYEGIELPRKWDSANYAVLKEYMVIKGIKPEPIEEFGGVMFRLPDRFIRGIWEREDGFGIGDYKMASTSWTTGRIIVEDKTGNKKADRIRKGLDIYLRNKVNTREQKIKIYKVQGTKEYTITHHLTTDEWECTCPDSSQAGYMCKHIWACIISEAPEKIEE